VEGVSAGLGPLNPNKAVREFCIAEVAHHVQTHHVHKSTQSLRDSPLRGRQGKRSISRLR
jgi:hypothetical protein